MNVKQQLVADVDRLSEQALRLVSVLVKEIISMNEELIPVRPSFNFGSMAGKVRMSDDFDDPIDDMKVYMV
jgi:hypothetical protein